MNYSLHTHSCEKTVENENTEMLLQFILENGVVVGVFQCLNRARQALCDRYGSACLLLDDNTTGDYLLVDLAM